MSATSPLAEFDLDRIAHACYSAVVSDVCDQLGMRHQTASPGLARLAGAAPVLVGWVRTASSVAVDRAPERPYGAEIDFIDSLSTGDVVVAHVGAEAAFWGELFSAAAMNRGTRGAVVDGLIRDQSRIDELDFPVWARGAQPADSLGRISLLRADQPLQVAGVEVASGDLVIADRDGVVFVPRARVAEVVPLAIAKAGTESQAKQLLRTGVTLAQAWETFHVL